MVSQASLVSRSSTASMSPASTAAAKRPASWRSRGEPGSGACSRPAGRRGPEARAAAAGAQRVQAAVCRDLVQPGARRRAALEAGEPAPRGQQGLLQHVLSVLSRAEDLVAVQQELAPVGVGELAERLLVARLRAGQRAGVHHRILASARPFPPLTGNDPIPAGNEPAAPFRPPPAAPPTIPEPRTAR